MDQAEHLEYGKYPQVVLLALALVPADQSVEVVVLCLASSLVEVKQTAADREVRTEHNRSAAGPQ